jgi:transketolase
LIIVDSHIGYGAPHKQDTAAAHGEALGEEEVRLAKRFYGWPEDAKFLVPEGVRARFDQAIGARGRKLSQDWYKLAERFGAKFPIFGLKSNAWTRVRFPNNGTGTFRRSPSMRKD